MTEVKCSGCKKNTCDGINPNTKQLYKSCQICRARNANWKQVIFGKNNNDTAVADNASLSLSETESNATYQTLPPEVDHVSTSPEREVNTLQTAEPQITLTLNSKINNVLNALVDTSKDIKNTIDGRDTSTKFIFEKIHGDLTNLRMILGNDADHNQFNRYELKVDKLVSRVDNMEMLLRTTFSDLEKSLSKKIDGVRDLI